MAYSHLPAWHSLITQEIHPYGIDESCKTWLGKMWILRLIDVESKLQKVTKDLKISFKTTSIETGWVIWCKNSPISSIKKLEHKNSSDAVLGKYLRRSLRQNFSVSFAGAVRWILCLFRGKLPCLVFGVQAFTDSPRVSSWII